jgi:hypothetical protein
MPLRLFVISLAVCAVLLPLGVAESTDCTSPVIVIPDGRLTQSSFPQNTTFWYGIFAQAGHSYSVEFEPPADNYLNATRPQFSALGVFGPTDYLQACRGSSSVAVTQNSGYAPVILKSGNGAGRRASFTALSAGLHLVSVTNVAGTGGYSFRAVDTTLITIRWNTSTGYDALWVLTNTSDMPITGTITAIDMNGQVIAAMHISIPPGGRVARSSAVGDMNLPRNAAGWAMFSHNGPPNAIVAEAFMIGPTSTLPEKFEPLTPR